MSAAFTLEMVGGVAVVTFDLPDESVNKFSPAVIDEFTAIIERLEQDAAVKAAVLISGKPGTFIAGADIDQFLAFKTASDAQTASAFGHTMMRRIERGRVPVVVAIDGTCLGGGLEFALACAYRVAADSPKTGTTWAGVIACSIGSMRSCSTASTSSSDRSRRTCSWTRGVTISLRRFPYAARLRRRSSRSAKRGCPIACGSATGSRRASSSISGRIDGSCARSRAARAC
jgi:hypothetical protein